MKNWSLQLKATITAHRKAIRELADFVYNHPETGFEEHQAATRQVALLRENGFDVTTGIGGLDTAFKAIYGHGQPVVAILSEYDALPEIGHACGHNLIMSAALSAGIAVRELMAANPEIPGTVVVVGTPAEESKGGKVMLLRQGIFDDIDFALASHPYPETLADQGALSVSRFTVRFHGKAAHAASSPHQGRNALDAMLLLFNGINCWRQQLPDSSRVHGVITSGGNVPNIIPDYTDAYFYLRALEISTHEEMETRFADIVKGAALMTGTTYELVKQDTPYLPIRINSPLNGFFLTQAPEYGLRPAGVNRYGMISTDVGNVSQQLPSANWFFKITDDGAPLHSEAFKAAAASDFAFEQAMKMGATLASAAWKLLSDATFRDTVAADFRGV